MVAIIRGGRKLSCMLPRNHGATQARQEISDALRFLRGQTMNLDLGDIQPIADPIVEINGIKITVELLAHAISTLTHPDPKMWYRFERRGAEVIVETKHEP
jgi:hypothetical protein